MCGALVFGFKTIRFQAWDQLSSECMLAWRGPFTAIFFFTIPAPTPQSVDWFKYFYSIVKYNMYVCIQVRVIKFFYSKSEWP